MKVKSFDLSEYNKLVTTVKNSLEIELRENLINLITDRGNDGIVVRVVMCLYF